MTKFPLQAPKPPIAFEHGSGFHAHPSKAIAKSPALEAATPKPQAKPKSNPRTDGKEDPATGGTVYSTETNKRKGLVLASRILAAWRQDPDNPNTVPPQDPD